MADIGIEEVTKLSVRDLDELCEAADDAIRGELFSVREGQVVTLRGYLVEARGGDGFRWKSSLTRNDTGGGACELMLVESVAVR